jgi:hypothetical protein
MDNQILLSGNEPQTCPAVGYQSVSVCVPVTIEPFADAGPTITRCLGEPVVKPGDSMCKGKKKGTCTFTISQDICVEVPINFGAKTTVGDTYVDCKESSDKEYLQVTQQVTQQQVTQ